MSEAPTTPATCEAAECARCEVLMTWIREQLGVATGNSNFKATPRHYAVLEQVHATDHAKIAALSEALREAREVMSSIADQAEDAVNDRTSPGSYDAKYLAETLRKALRATTKGEGTETESPARRGRL